MVAWRLRFLTHAPLPLGDAEDRLALNRVVLELGGRRGLAAFRAERDAVDVLFLGSRVEQGRMRHDLANSLRAWLHLEGSFRAVFSVGLPTAEKVIATTLDLLRGRDRRRDPLHEASSLPDLAGARVGSGWQAERLTLVGIRPTPSFLAECLGLDALEPAFSLPHLPESAAAAVGLVRLGTKEPLDVAARLAAMHLAAPHVGARAASRMLGHSRPTGYRLLRCAPDPAVTRAIGLQMALRLRPPPPRLRPPHRYFAA